MEVKLSNGFELARGDLERIKSAIKSVVGSCVVRSALLEIAADPQGHKVIGSNKTFLKEKDLLKPDGTMSEDVQNVVLVAFGYASADETSQDDLSGKECPCLDIDNLHFEIFAESCKCSIV